MSKVVKENTVEQEAMRYLEDQAYAALLKYKEPIRSAEISGEIGNEQYSSKLIRHILAASSRFAQIDRRWDLEIRYEDKQRPMERLLNGIIAEYGRPMTVEQVANELSSIYERSGSYYEPIVRRIFSDEDKFFSMSEGLFGARDWLLDVEFDEEDDVFFYNELDQKAINSIGRTAKVDWKADPVTAANEFLSLTKTPINNKIIGYFRWKALGDQYDAVADFDKLFSNPNLVWISDQRWADKTMIDSYNSLLSDLADQLAEEIIEEAPAAVVENAEIAEEAAPTLSLTISERDLDEVAQIVSAKGEALMPAILESIFEISPRDPIYPVAAEGLGDAMRLDSRFVWVGTERWRMADTIPGYASVIPAELEIPKFFFETAEGERLDVELEDDGLEGGLAIEIHNPLVQDIGDQDTITEQDELPVVESARCTLSKHHLKLGTFPLCQIPKTFFPAGPHLIEVTLTSGEKSNDIWINRDTGLVYDMDKWYTEEMPESGALFHIIRTQKPDQFQFVYENETDPLVFVPANRVQELLELAEETKENELTTLDLMTRIMPYHRKGIPFVTLFTEVNLVRRTTRRLVASILSSYYAFYQRPKSALWHFDEKKVDQGFKKAKRKYVRKEK